MCDINKVFTKGISVDGSLNSHDQPEVLGGSYKLSDRKCYTVVYRWRSEDKTVTVETVKTRDGVNGAVDEVILELLKSGYSVTAMPVDILAVFEGAHSASIMPGAYTGKFKGTMDNADAW